MFSHLSDALPELWSLSAVRRLPTLERGWRRSAEAMPFELTTPEAALEAMKEAGVCSEHASTRGLLVCRQQHFSGPKVSYSSRSITMCCLRKLLCMSVGMLPPPTEPGAHVPWVVETSIAGTSKPVLEPQACHYLRL